MPFSLAQLPLKQAEPPSPRPPQDACHRQGSHEDQEESLLSLSFEFLLKRTLGLKAGWLAPSTRPSADRVQKCQGGHARVPLPYPTHRESWAAAGAPRWGLCCSGKEAHG